MHMLLSIFLWVLVGVMSSYFALQRGRDPVVWFIIGMLFGVLGLLALLLLPPVEKEKAPTAGSDIELNADGSFGQQPLTHPLRDYALKEWYYYDTEHEQHGPAGFQILKSEWGQGKVNADSFIWSEGMENWKKIGDIPEMLNEMHLSEWKEG